MTQHAKERLGRSGYLLIGVCILACAAGLLHVSDRPRNGIDATLLEEEMKERLLLGSSWEEGQAWLDSHGFRYSIVLRGHDARKAELLAIIPNDSYLETAQIVISLTYTQDGRLERQAIWRMVRKQ